MVYALGQFANAKRDRNVVKSGSGGSVFYIPVSIFALKLHQAH